MKQWNAELGEALAKWLAARPDDAESALAAGLMAPLLAADGTAPEDISDRVAAALGEAGRLRPDDPGIAWLEAMRCPPGSTLCDRTSALQRLMRLDADNAEVWMVAAERAYQDGDMAAFDEYLHLAAQASHYDSRYDTGAKLLADLLASMPLPPRSPQADRTLRNIADLDGSPALSDADFSTVLASLHDPGVGDLPSFSPLTRACRPPLPVSRRRDCMGTSTRMAEADILLARVMGVYQMVVLTVGTPANRYWRERLRQEKWLLSVGARFPGQKGPDRARAVWQLGEAPALQAWLKANDHAMPPGWLPDDPRQRDLITLGPSG
ncbi:hypothetical protein [Lysobacter sp. GCM10012299]|uniref:hypothetical protein n=1 Tax=Lysobacter sp. GCM10012299 TaxID=3317333 RepID=UPI00361895FC